MALISVTPPLERRSSGARADSTSLIYLLHPFAAAPSRQILQGLEVHRAGRRTCLASVWLAGILWADRGFEHRSADVCQSARALPAGARGRSSTARTQVSLLVAAELPVGVASGDARLAPAPAARGRSTLTRGRPPG